MVIRGTVVILLFVFSFSLAWSGSTPENTIEEFYNIRKNFYIKYHPLGDGSVNYVEYPSILSELYKKTTTGELLKGLLSAIEQFNLASCAGEYLFPEVPIKIISNKVSLQTSTKAIATYAIVVEKNWWSGELFSGEDYTQLRSVYEYYDIVEPKFEEVKNKLYSDKDDLSDIVVTAPGVTTFYLDKTSSGWRIKKCLSKYSRSTLDWTTDPL